MWDLLNIIRTLKRFRETIVAPVGTKSGECCPWVLFRNVVDLPDNLTNLISYYWQTNTAGKATTRRPVVLFIHGESFSWGSGNLYDGSAFAAHGRLVVVTINYRLGILGKLFH